MHDGNYVMASKHPQPWRKQLNILVAYTYFYNPVRLLHAIIKPYKKRSRSAALFQLAGMNGLRYTYQRTLPWLWKLVRGPIRFRKGIPSSLIPMRGVGGGRAAHDITPIPVGSYESELVEAAKPAAR